MSTAATTAYLHPKDQETADWLDSLGVKYEYVPGLPIASINKKASLDNGSRPTGAIDKETVERYKNDYENGDQFPALLVRKVPDTGVVKGKLYNLGGNHRLVAALDAKVEKHSVFLIETEAGMATRLMFEDNRRHGKAPSNEERAIAAYQLIEGQGFTQGDAARVVGISQSSMSRHIGIWKTKKRVEKLGVEDWDNLGSSVQWRLGSIKSDPLFIAAAELCIEHKANVEKAWGLAQKLNGVSSEAEGMTLIGNTASEWEAEHEAAAGGMARKNDANRVRTALTNILDADPEKVVMGAATPDAKSVLANRIAKTIEHLNKMRHDLNAGLPQSARG